MPPRAPVTSATLTSVFEQRGDRLAAVDAADHLGEERSDRDAVRAAGRRLRPRLDRVGAEELLDRRAVERRAAAGEDTVRDRGEDPLRTALAQDPRRVDERPAREHDVVDEDRVAA